MFYNIGSWINFIKLQLILETNKVECLSQKVFPTQSNILGQSLESTLRVKNLIVRKYFIANIRLGWKGVTVAKRQSFFVWSVSDKEKSFIELTPSQDVFLVTTIHIQIQISEIVKHIYVYVMLRTVVLFVCFHCDPAFFRKFTILYLDGGRG